MTLTLYRPALPELDFRKKLLADPETMTYNHACGGTIDFPAERWPDWYTRWMSSPDRFYRYLKNQEGAFVGEAAYHLDPEQDIYLCDVLVLAEYRGRGYGGQGLELLCAAAQENGVERLYDDIAADNSAAVKLFLRHGFQIVSRTPEVVLVRKDLLEDTT